MGSLKRGVLLLALGHYNYYNMAVTLASSIKVNSKDLPITLVHSGLYDPAHERLFDNRIYVNEQSDFIKHKTLLYDYSPYQQTLYLDVDMIILYEKDIRELFIELQGTGFSIMNKPGDNAIWADPAEIRKVADNSTDPMHVFYSELIYFEKNKDIKRFFGEVKKQYAKPLIENRTFAGGMADELAFTIAALKLKIKPHADNWLPIFWHFRDKKDTYMQPYQLSKKYYGYSIGGNAIPEYIKSNYNNLAILYAQTMGLPKPAKIKDKKTYLESRTKI